MDVSKQELIGKPTAREVEVSFVSTDALTASLEAELWSQEKGWIMPELKTQFNFIIGLCDAFLVISCLQGVLP
jgi:hypothetical protein